jgi:hypothetical protein
VSGYLYTCSALPDSLALPVSLLLKFSAWVLGDAVSAVMFVLKREAEKDGKILLQILRELRVESEGHVLSIIFKTSEPTNRRAGRYVLVKNPQDQDMRNC